MPQRHRKFGPSDGGVPHKSRRPFGRYFVPYIIEPYQYIIIKRNDNNFLNNLCFIQNQHRPLKFNHPLYVLYFIMRLKKKLKIVKVCSKKKKGGDMEYESHPSTSADRSEETFSADSSSPESVTNISDTTEVKVICNSNAIKLYA